MASSSYASNKWWHRDTTPGYILLAATALSFLLQNSGAGDAFRAFLKTDVDINVAGYSAHYTVVKLVKDALMAVFFLYVGLELKRECIEGPFRNLREAALPAMGAVGGMLAPAALYILVALHLHPEGDAEYLRGWAIPSATDIAFAVGVLSLLGNRVPGGLRLFLLALAIADDLGAILIIALFYSGDIAMGPLAISGAIFAAMMAMNWIKVKALWPYIIGAIALWFAMAKTGVSPTLAGVLAALAVPMRRPDGGSPLVDLEHALKLPVQLGIMPVFALAVAGVNLAGESLAGVFHPVTLGIAAGLVIGKPLGIVTLTWLAGKLLKQPTPATILQMAGVAMIAGIGFTMSLFVGALAFPTHPELEAYVRFGVLGGSTLAAIGGLLLLSSVLPKHEAKDPNTPLSFEEEVAEERGVLENKD
ncbi:MAG: Na+/H+ antiporter NhaA [Hyphomonadaceae bacterium]|nr:Na+/H+ antiporter NhaA [Hyphomonadaceae bacterium]